MGIAPALRDKRVMLAGDAGNPILPNGGQGLNTGIQDSLNLAWKLAAVVQGRAKDTLLDTYEQERLPLRQALEKVQWNSLKYTTQTSGIMRYLIRKLGNPLLNNGGEYQMAKAFSQLGVHYKKSPLTVDTLKNGKVKAGERPINAEVVNAATLAEVQLTDLLALPTWKLVCFNLGETDVPAIQAIMPSLASTTKLEFIPIIITTSARNEVDTRYLYYDVDEVAHKAYAITQPTLLLVRPDQYIGVKTGKSNWAALWAYTHHWFHADGVYSPDKVFG